ncbi:hypothetical protein AeMF1_004569 [Aphanomyces euteiches]|nr:hypothetical protein AeMF1_004569 [Aphanomyces euteiches]
MASPQFFRVNCTHKQFFSQSYIRCYQNHGLKVGSFFAWLNRHTICRSFGVFRIVVRTWSIEDTWTTCMPLVASEAAIADGERCEWTTFTSDLRSKNNVCGMWLEGLREDSENCTQVFHFNKTRTDGWHYNWHGGSSKQQRNELHRFHVVLVYFVQRESDTMCTIILSAYSTPFTLSSYRRTIGDQERKKISKLKKKVKISPTPQQILNDHGLENSNWLARLFQLCSAISIDDIPLDQWSALEESLLLRCAEWSGLGKFPDLPIIPDNLRQYSRKRWSLASEIGMNILWSWFNRTTFELFQQVFQTHRTSDNYRIAYEASVNAFHSVFVTEELKKMLSSIDKSHARDRVGKSKPNDDNFGYDAFVCALRESAMVWV